jgi:hypothetical protein
MRVCVYAHPKFQSRGGGKACSRACSEGAHFTRGPALGKRCRLTTGRQLTPVSMREWPGAGAGKRAAVLSGVGARCRERCIGARSAGGAGQACSSGAHPGSAAWQGSRGARCRSGQSQCTGLAGGRQRRFGLRPGAARLRADLRAALKEGSGSEAAAAGPTWAAPRVLRVHVILKLPAAGVEAHVVKLAGCPAGRQGPAPGGGGGPRQAPLSCTRKLPRPCAATACDGATPVCSRVPVVVKLLAHASVGRVLGGDAPGGTLRLQRPRARKRRRTGTGAVVQSSLSGWPRTPVCFLRILCSGTVDEGDEPFAALSWLTGGWAERRRLAGRVRGQRAVQHQAPDSPATEKTRESSRQSPTCCTPNLRGF